jgi:hypothetical protein
MEVYLLRALACYDTLENYYDQAEKLYSVHGKRGVIRVNRRQSLTILCLLCL